MQSRETQPTLHKTAQSCAWQQKALWRSRCKPFYKFPYISPCPWSKCLYIGAHISASTHVITEPEEGAHMGRSKSGVKCKHLTSHTREGGTTSQHRPKSYRCTITAAGT